MGSLTATMIANLEGKCEQRTLEYWIAKWIESDFVAIGQYSLPYYGLP